MKNDFKCPRAAMRAGLAACVLALAGCAVGLPTFDLEGHRGAVNDVNAELVREAQSLGLKVVVWTVNEPAQIDKMLALGVDGIISDRPDRVRTAMAARGMPLP